MKRELAARPLGVIATELCREAEQAEEHWQSAVGHAIRAGELLLEAKGQVEHGEWLPWLEANFPASARTAQGYMRLARERGDAQALAHLGIEHALRELATPKRLVLRPDPNDDSIVMRGPHGVVFRDTGAEFPSDLTFTQWSEIGVFIAALSPKEQG